VFVATPATSFTVSETRASNNGRRGVYNGTYGADAAYSRLDFSSSAGSNKPFRNLAMTASSESARFLGWGGLLNPPLSVLRFIFESDATRIVRGARNLCLTNVPLNHTEVFRGR
jgi:hypothetical protein